jgi:hypothetical protein
MNTRKKAWWIIGGSVAFLGMLIGAKLLVTPKPICDPEVHSKTVIVLDHSESVPGQTIEAIVERAWQFVETKTLEGELVSVYTLSQLSKNNFKPSFSACKAPKEGNRGIEDVKRLKRDFEENFKKPLVRELGSKIEDSDESPIAQALIDLSLDDKHFRSTDVTHVLVFSDFIENTPKFSMYKCNNFGTTIQLFRNSRVGSVERPSFENTDIRLNIIPRHNITRPVLECRDKFWNWFFGDMKDSNKKSGLIRDNLPG